MVNRLHARSRVFRAACHHSGGARRGQSRVRLPSRSIRSIRAIRGSPGSLPLFVLLFAAIAIGMIVGSLATWVKQGRYRKLARQRSQEAEAAAAGRRPLAGPAPLPQPAAAVIRQPRPRRHAMLHPARPTTSTAR